MSLLMAMSVLAVVAMNSMGNELLLLAEEPGRLPALGTAAARDCDLEPLDAFSFLTEAFSFLTKDTDDDGGDADDDGIPNAFDVNDDGDAKVDSADSVTPEPNVTGSSTDAATCEAAASFHIFTNYKATAPNFADTLNFYGTGIHGATDASIFTQVAASMSMVFSPITQVCGDAVTKMEIKGVGVSYAPADYAEVTAGSTGDIQ